MRTGGLAFLLQVLALSFVAVTNGLECYKCISYLNSRVKEGYVPSCLHPAYSNVPKETCRADRNSCAKSIGVLRIKLGGKDNDIWLPRVVLRYCAMYSRRRVNFYTNSSGVIFKYGGITDDMLQKWRPTFHKDYSQHLTADKVFVEMVNTARCDANACNDWPRKELPRTRGTASSAKTWSPFHVVPSLMLIILCASADLNVETRRNFG